MKKSKDSRDVNLLDTYLDYHNLKLISSSKDKPHRDGMPFMPMFLMHVMNMIYNEYIAPLDLRHKEKQLRTRWIESYKCFRSGFYVPFNDDQKCELVAMMVDFEEYINNEVEIFRTTIMSKFMQYDIETRLVLSATLACNTLAQSAQIIHKAQRRKANANIKDVEEWSLKFLNEYADKRIDRTNRNIDLNEYEPLRIASRNLCNRVREFAERCEF